MAFTEFRVKLHQVRIDFEPQVLKISIDGVEKQRIQNTREMVTQNLRWTDLLRI